MTREDPLARELTDPGTNPAPTEAEVELALVEIGRTHPEASLLMRRAMAACEAERFTFRLFREMIEHLERSTGAQRELARVVDQMAEPYSRAVVALEAELAVKRLTVELEQRRETNRHEEAEHGRTTALEHIKGAWLVVHAAAKNRAVIAAVSGGIMWLATRLFGGLDAWWQP